MVALSMSVDTSGIVKQMARLQRDLGKTPEEAVKMGTIAAMKAMAGSTKKAPNKRPIVKNPNPHAGVDGRVAVFGVNKYLKGVKTFVPIYRTGEFGKIRFKSRTTAEWLVRDRVTGEVHRQEWATGSGEFSVAGIDQSKKRNINRAGLAKLTWMLALQRLFGTRPPSVRFALPFRAYLTTQKTARGSDYAVSLNNFLDYISHAMKQGGRQAVSGAMKRAANVMESRINMRLKGALR